MTATACHLELSTEERELLTGLLEQALVESRREEHRSETFAYRDFLQGRQTVLERLVARLKECAGARGRDEVQLASEGSFPASDPPAWTPIQSVGGPKRSGHPASKKQAP